MKSKENPASNWEILEIVQSASDSVKPAAVKMAQKVASQGLAKRRKLPQPAGVFEVGLVKFEGGD